jgi:hypothetical protein
LHFRAPMMIATVTTGWRYVIASFGSMTRAPRRVKPRASQGRHLAGSEQLGDEIVDQTWCRRNTAKFNHEPSLADEMQAHHIDSAREIVLINHIWS